MITVFTVPVSQPEENCHGVFYRVYCIVCLTLYHFLSTAFKDDHVVQFREVKLDFKLYYINIVLIYALEKQAKGKSTCP